MLLLIFNIIKYISTIGGSSDRKGLIILERANVIISRVSVKSVRSAMSARSANDLSVAKLKKIEGVRTSVYRNQERINNSLK